MTRQAKASSEVSISDQRSFPPNRFAFLLGAIATLALTLVLGTTLAAATVPTVTIEDASNVTYNSARASGTVDPQDHETTYRFEYATQADFSDAVSAGEQGPLAEGSGPQPVETTLSGLAPSTTYHLRLVASNSDGPSEAVAPDTFTTPAAPKPAVDREYASKVSLTQADLNARIDPNGFDTTYHFEYGPADCSANPCTSVPVTDADIGSEDVPEPGIDLPKHDPYATQHLAGLSPNTTYHFRVIATSASGTTEGEDRTFLTHAPVEAGLPENRAYELVSPTDKNGGDIANDQLRTHVALDGNSVAFMSTTPFADAGGSGLSDDYVAHRGAGGWITHGLTPDQPPNEFGLPNLTSATEYVSDFSPDFSRAVIKARTPLTEAPNVANAVNLYLRTNVLDGGPNPGQDAHYELLSDATEPQAQGESDQGLGPFGGTRIKLADATPDLSHVIFESARNLTQDTVDQGLPTKNTATGGAGLKLYEWDSGSERLASILPDGTPTTGVAGNSAKAYFYTHGTISDDGLKVFFTALPMEDVPGEPVSRGTAELNPQGQLFMRLDHSLTVHLNATEKTNGTGPGGTDPAGTGVARFAGISPDGSKAFFTTREQLTNDDDNTVPDLYMYDTTKVPGDGNLTRVSVDSYSPDNTRGNGESDVLQMFGEPSDSGYVYFISENQLLSGMPNRAGLREHYIYAWHDGTIRYVAGIEDEHQAYYWGDFGGIAPSGYYTDGSQVRMSPDGKTVAFWVGGKTGDLTGYDNADTADRENGEGVLKHYYEVYVYDYEGDKLVCASCDPSGEPPTVPASADLVPGGTFGLDAQFSYYLDGGALGELGHFAGNNQHLTNALSEDGSKVWFTSRSPLVPQDTNGRYDVYQYDVSSGKLHLLSTGQCNCDSIFADATPSGSDVFFTTSQQLVRIDTDRNVDLYDARVNGGIAAQNALPPAQCEGDACQPAAVAPNDATPASAGFKGPGNPSQAKKRHHKKHKHRRKAHHKLTTHTTAKHG